MKIYLLMLVFFVSFLGFAQNNYIVKTEDGRRVLLKSDFTWEYIDLEKPADKKNMPLTSNALETKSNQCDVAADFVEPELDNNLQAQLKKGRATIEHIKAKVAKDNNCTVEEVLLLYASEDKKKGIYGFCANGKKVSYKRTGLNIAKNKKFLQF